MQKQKGFMLKMFVSIHFLYNLLYSSLHYKQGV